jgi:tetratricopeptide (TPR) repeat protein
MNMLGLLYRSEGKYAESEPVLIKALEIRRRILGADHPDTIKSMASLANLHRSEGKSAEAETLLASVLETRRRVLGPAHPDTTNVMALLGEVRLRQKKYAEAEVLLREAQNNNEKTAADSWGIGAKTCSAPAWPVRANMRRRSHYWFPGIKACNNGKPQFLWKTAVCYSRRESGLFNSTKSGRSPRR